MFFNILKLCQALSFAGAKFFNYSLHSPRSQVKANCIELPPAPQNASTMISQRHLSAMCSAILSGVTENQLSGQKSDQLFVTTVLQM